MFNELMLKKPKTDYFFNIDIDFELGFVVNLDETGTTDDSIWIDFNDHTNYKKYVSSLPLNHKNISIKILINDTEILNNRLDAAEALNKLNFKFKFSEITVTNLLEFKISGFEQQHMLLLSSGLGARPAIRIKKINFEDVNILTVFTEHSKFRFNEIETIGDITFTCNGTSKFEFETPIYCWLLKNKQLIDCY